MISSRDVLLFKTVYSDENGLIAGILRTSFASEIFEPILDVGAGLGDIAQSAFRDKRVLLLDALPFDRQGLSDRHTEMLGTFHEYASLQRPPVGTVLFSHVLQFLDSDVEQLGNDVAALSPQSIITVTNANDDVMGEIIEWARSTLPIVNPESDILGFPPGFAKRVSEDFVGTVSSATFDQLAEQVLYLLDSVRTTGTMREVTRFLQRRLPSPQFTIHQRITSYRPCQTISKPYSASSATTKFV